MRGFVRKINLRICKFSVYSLFLIVSTIILSWNCRGAGSKSFPRIFKDLIKKYNMNVMGLFGTRISGEKAEKVVRRLGFSN